MSEKPQKQTSKNVIRSAFYGSLTWFLPLGLSFVATPIIVGALGHSDYGIYALVLGFIGYSFSFSFGRAITKYIAEYRVSGESEKISSIISASLLLNIVVGLIGVATICLMANWLVGDVFQIDEASRQKTVIALYIASATIFISMLNQLFAAVLQGLHRFDLYSRIFTASGFFTIGGNLTLALLGFGLVELLLWNLLVVSAFCLVFAYYAKRNLPEFTLRPSFDRTTLRLVMRYNAGIVGYQIMANALLLFERGWITHRLGPESLTFYIIPMSLGMYLQGFVSSLVQVVFPLASELNQDREKLLRLYTKATKIITTVVVFVMVSVAVNAGLFLKLWMGDEFVVNSKDLLIIHIVAFGLTSILAISWQMSEGLGFPHYNLAIFSFCLVVCVTLMVILTPNYGNLGVAIARLAGFGGIFFSLFIVERLFFKHVQGEFWLKLVGCLGLASIAAAALEYAISSSLAPNWGTFLLSSAVGGVVYLIVLWLLNFVSDDERAMMRQMLKR